MQRIFQTSLTPEEYAQAEYHRQVHPPESCPNCNRAHSLEALAYYRRYITTATVLVLLIWVRRFLCRHCRVTVSCLPSFAQPYRVVNTPTVEAGFKEEATPQVARWSGLIGTYWQRFESHLPMLLRQVGSAFGLAPVRVTARGFWRPLLKQCGSLAEATRSLIHEFHTCLYGTYRCHQRRGLRGK